VGLFGFVTRKEAEMEKRLAVMESQRSSTLQNPSQELINALSAIGLWGKGTEAGVVVDDKATLGLAAFARGLSLISDGIASMPLKRYSKVSGNRTEIEDDLVRRPNPWQTTFQWVKYMAVMQAARGNAYSRLVRDQYSRVTMTIPIHPRYVKPVLVDNDLFYRVELQGHPKVVHYSDMIHWKGLCYDNAIEGISPIEYHAQTLGIDISAEKSHARFNKAGAKKFAITGESGKVISPEAKSSLKQDIEDVLNNQANSLLIPNGLKLDYLTTTPAEAQFLETRKYSAVDIARILNVPASILDADTAANKASVEQDALNFYTLTLHPKTTDFAQELDYKLLTSPDEYYKFNFNSLLRADANTRADVYGKLLALGWSNNEIRSLEDVNGFEGGDVRRTALQNIPIDMEHEYYEAKITSMEKGQTNNPTGDNNNTQN